MRKATLIFCYAIRKLKRKRVQEYELWTNYYCKRKLFWRMRNIYGLLSVFNAPINQHTIECTTIIQQRYHTLYNHFLRNRRNTDMSSISNTYFGLQRYPNPCNSFLCNTDSLQYGHFYLFQFSWFCCPYSELAKVPVDVHHSKTPLLKLPISYMVHG